MITILTPVYNRSTLMKRLYRSLCEQTNKNFEWLIIDDGSTDDLQLCVDEWIKTESGFIIRYYYQENGGKHRAWNNGVKMAKGDYIFVVDSDDYITEQTIETVYGWITQIDEDKRYAGVSGCKGYLCDGKVTIYGAYPSDMDYVDASNLQRHRPNLTGDKAEVYRTELLRQFPFPEFEGEKFCSEDVVFHRIARAGYILRWFPDGILIGDYLQDGLTQNVVKKRLEYLQGYTFSIKNGMKYDQFPYNYIAIGEYIWVLIKNGFTIKDAMKEVEISYVTAMAAICTFLLVRFRRRVLDEFEKYNK